MVLPAEFPLGLEANWMSPDGAAKVDPYLKNWLLDTGSLTERLQSLCRRFEVRLLGQGQHPLHDNETDWLTQAAHQVHQVREVLLCGDGEPWVFARSVIPQAMLEGELHGLGNQPLGKRLFNDPRFRRGGFEVCCIPAPGWAGHGRLWGRRSRFYLNDWCMIVAEVFLPEAPAYEGE